MAAACISTSIALSLLLILGFVCSSLVFAHVEKFSSYLIQGFVAQNGDSEE